VCHQTSVNIYYVAGVDYKSVNSRYQPDIAPPLDFNSVFFVPLTDARISENVYDSREYKMLMQVFWNLIH